MVLAPLQNAGCVVTSSIRSAPTYTARPSRMRSSFCAPVASTAYPDRLKLQPVHSSLPDLIRQSILPKTLFMMDAPVKPAHDHRKNWVISLLHQQQRVGRERHALPGGGIAFAEAPGAGAAREHELLAIEPPGREPEGRDPGVAAGLHHDLVGLAAAGSVRQRQLAQWLVEFAQDLPFAENLLGAAGLGLEPGLGLHEVEAFALALGLVHAAFDFAELEQRHVLGIEQAQRVLGAEAPCHHILERTDRAGRIEVELEAARHGIDAEAHRTALVTIRVGD